MSHPKQLRSLKSFERRPTCEAAVQARGLGRRFVGHSYKAQIDLAAQGGLVIGQTAIWEVSASGESSPTRRKRTCNDSPSTYCGFYVPRRSALATGGAELCDLFLRGRASLGLASSAVTTY